MRMSIKLTLFSVFTNRVAAEAMPMTPVGRINRGGVQAAVRRKPSNASSSASSAAAHAPFAPESVAT